MTIYGVGLGPVALTPFPGTNPLPLALPIVAPSTSITINGDAAPLLYTSATQVSCIVPYAIAAQTGTAVNLVLTYSGTASLPFTVNVVATDPGMFTLDASGVGQGAILNFNSTTGNYTVNTATNAATAGSIVVLYATGFGVITCASTPSSPCTATPDETQLVARRNAIGRRNGDAFGHGSGNHRWSDRDGTGSAGAHWIRARSAADQCHCAGGHPRQQRPCHR